MNRTFTDNAWQDYLSYQKQDNKSLKRVNALIKDISRHPRTGIGKPEQLHNHQYGDAWSRRVNSKDRIVYSIFDDQIVFLECRTHYGDK